jgi:hypothetical protein
VSSKPFFSDISRNWLMAHTRYPPTTSKLAVSARDQRVLSWFDPSQNAMVEKEPFSDKPKVIVTNAPAGKIGLVAITIIKYVIMGWLKLMILFQNV